MAKAKAAVSRKGAAAKPVLGGEERSATGGRNGPAAHFERRTPGAKAQGRGPTENLHEKAR